MELWLEKDALDWHYSICSITTTTKELTQNELKHSNIKTTGWRLIYSFHTLPFRKGQNNIYFPFRSGIRKCVTLIEWFGLGECDSNSIQPFIFLMSFFSGGK